MRSFDEHPEYELEGLPDGALGPDPLAALQLWLDEAEAAGLTDPNAMVVGTIASDGRPTSRTVLWKGVVGGALAFYTNRESAKGMALAHEPRVSLLFPWYALHRQVRVERAGTPHELQAFAGRRGVAGVIQVGQQQLVRPLPQMIEDGGGGGDEVGVEVGALQQEAQGLEHIRLVVRHENTGSHGGTDSNRRASPPG